MKKLILGIAVMALGVGLFGTSASGQLWWENPALKSKTVCDNWHDAFQYANMDEAGKYISFNLGYSIGTPLIIFETEDLIAATTATNTPWLFKGTAQNTGWTAYKNTALSGTLGRVLVFNGGTVRQATSGPLAPTWTRGTTSFVVTNNANIYFDSGDFDHLGEYVYLNCSSPSARRNTIWKHAVGNLEAHGSNASPNLTSNKVITTANARVRNLSVYNIDGKDLIFYGSGTGDSAGGKVWVYDTSTDIETQLIQQGGGVPYGVSGDHDIMNVKVSGIGTTQMWLYVTEQIGRTNTADLAGIQIFPLAADGKSVGAKVKDLPYRDLTAVVDCLGYSPANYLEWRAFDVSPDGKYAFIANNLYPPSIAYAYTMYTPPPMGTTFLVR